MLNNPIKAKISPTKFKDIAKLRLPNIKNNNNKRVIQSINKKESQYRE